MKRLSVLLLVIGSLAAVGYALAVMVYDPHLPPPSSQALIVNAAYTPTVEGNSSGLPAQNRFQLVCGKTWVQQDGAGIEINVMLKVDTYTGRTWMLELIGKGTTNPGVCNFTLVPDSATAPAL